MSDDPFQADDAATPLTPEERLDLKLSYVTLRRELNEAEALNVLAGERWALSRKRNALDEVFLRRLHLRMFGDVWRWAGGPVRALERTIVKNAVSLAGRAPSRSNRKSRPEAMRSRWR
jgi:fido (protein-threonine AMPylation protein)